MAKNPRQSGGSRRDPIKRPHGHLRRSQLLTTFGPGALIDLPDYSVLVSGLEHWFGPMTTLYEPRLLQKIRDNLPEVHELRTPPLDLDTDQPNAGITVWQFPEWFITQEAVTTRFGRSRRLVHRQALHKRRFEDEDHRQWRVVPVRFVRACLHGHLGDIDWYWFTHEGDAGGCRRPLWLDERGTSGDISEVWVRCECGKRRLMSDAATVQFRALGHCDGGRPWLGRYHTREACSEPNRLLVRTASNAYFPELMSVISLPLEPDDPLMAVISAQWENLSEVTTVDELQTLRRLVKPVKQALEGLEDDAILAAIQARQEAASGQVTSHTIKEAELEVLTTPRDRLGSDQLDSDFYARALPRSEWESPDSPWMGAVERVLLVHRLREVMALIGFTRFEAAVPDIQGELEVNVQLAALASEAHWRPAIENRGEGVFISFQPAAIQAWQKQPAVIQRGLQLVQGFRCWQAEHSQSRREFPGLPYILLHTLSHLLLTAIALECGYPASSIRERVYASDFGYGILLYTATADAEGTLGGLVEAGRHLRHHLKTALELARLCANDPVCAQHKPDNPHERRFLHGAACHGCLLIAETSCEQFNDFLDRALVVPTVDLAEAAFFGAEW